MVYILGFGLQYTYFVGVCLFFVVWLVIFSRRNTNRKEMLTLGGLFGLAAYVIGIKYSLGDYWHPVYLFNNLHIEDFLYGFFFGGVCTQIYFSLFRVREIDTHKHRPFFVSVALLISISSFLLLTDVLRFNSIVAHIVPPLLIGIYIAYKGHKTLKIQIVSGILSMIVTMIVFKVLIVLNPRFVIDVWDLDNLSGYLFLGVPIEEYLFAFSLGFGASLFYEYSVGKRILQ